MSTKNKSEYYKGKVTWAQSYREQMQKNVIGGRNRYVDKKRLEFLNVASVRTDYDQFLFDAYWIRLDRMEHSLRNLMLFEWKLNYGRLLRKYKNTSGEEKKKLRGQLKRMQDIRKAFPDYFQTYVPPEEWRQRWDLTWQRICAKLGEKRLSKNDAVSDLAGHCTAHTGKKRTHFKVGN